MKKLLLAFTILSIIILSSCNADITGNDDTSNFEEQSIQTEENNILDMASQQLKEKYIEAYISGEFITQNEELCEKYSSLGYSISNAHNNMRKTGLLGALQVCYYPVEIDGTLFYINNMGTLCLGAHYGQSITDIHVSDNISERYTTISNSPEETVILRENVIEAYSFGKLIRSWNIPDEWVGDFSYCGYSYFSGFIFKSSNNVYAIDLSDSESDFYLLASNVEKVIDADYEYSIDAWCTPLFLMEDGSIKAYIEWDGKLYDLHHEGEWNDVHTPHIPYEYMY